MFIDSHCHLNCLDLSRYPEAGLDEALNQARQAGVDTMLCVAIDLEHISEVLEIAETHSDVFASVGVHPSSFDGAEPDYQTLVDLSRHPKVIAIGESGLDYYYSSDKKQQQLQRFKLHLQVSKETKKPIIIHTRDARKDTIDMIREHSDQDVGGVLHCFTENWEMAREALDMNFYISFSGIVTFKNAVELKEVAKQVPMDRILIETDSPYLAPVPYRGKPNEPKYVPEVARCLAELKNLSVEDIAIATSANFRRLFRLGVTV